MTAIAMTYPLTITLHDGYMHHVFTVDTTGENSIVAVEVACRIGLRLAGFTFTHRIVMTADTETP